MPAVFLHLDPDAIAAIDADRSPVMPPARLSRGQWVAWVVRHHLAQKSEDVARELGATLRLYPRKGRLPIALQDQALALISAGHDRLVPLLLKAGQWERQVSALAQKWTQDGLSREDLCSAGMMGLMRAIRGYKPGGGFRTYAYLWIRKEIERACRAGGSLLIESEQEMRVRRTVERLRRRGLSPKEIAAKAGMSPEQVQRGLQGRRRLGWKDLDARTM